MEATGLPAIDFPGRGLISAENPASEKGPREFILFRKIQGALRCLPDFPDTRRAIPDEVMDEMEAENCSVMLQAPCSGELVGAAQNDESAQGLREEDPVPPRQPSLKQVRRDAARKAEAKVILKVLEMTHFNRKKAAQLLNINYRGLLYKIRECGIKRHLDWKEP